MMVAEDLEFDVGGAFDVAFDQERAIAKSPLGFASGGLQCFIELRGPGNDAHPATAAARGSFDEKKFDRGCGIDRGDHGNASGIGCFTCGDLRTRMASAAGSMNVMPACWQASANPSFSARKP